MAIYTVEYNGQTFDIEGPDNASEADLKSFVESQGAPTSSATETPVKQDSDAFRANAESIEPGVYGDTNPAGQKMLEKFADIASVASLGTFGPRVGMKGLEVAGKVIPGGIKNAVKGAFRTQRGIGNEMEALERAAKINTKATIVAPPASKMAETIDTLTGLSNKAKGTKIHPQVLRDRFRLASEILDTKKLSGVNKSTVAQAKEGIGQALNVAVPGREALAQQIAAAKLRTKLLTGATGLTGAYGISQAVLNALRGK